MATQVEWESNAGVEHVPAPWWYHPTRSALLAVLVASQALPGVYPLFLVIPALVAVAFVSGIARRRHGVAPPGPIGHRSWWMLIAFVVILVVAMASVAALRTSDGSLWWTLLPVAAVFSANLLLGPRYDRAIHHELTDRGRRPA